MKTVIITDNARQAEFICQGFRYENLSSEVCSSFEVDFLKKNLCFYDGIFLLLHSEETFQSVGSFCTMVAPSIPLILLAQKDGYELRKISEALEAQYFAARPFSFRAIAAEMRSAIFRAKETGEDQTFVLRDLKLDVAGHRFFCKGHEVSLRNKEFALLQFFMTHQESILSRTELLENVWDRNSSMLTNTVDVHVSQLRKKIRAFSDDIYIHTVPCRGYIFA